MRSFDRRDGVALLGVVGFGLLVWGVAQIHVPAAFIVGGGALVGLAVWRVR